MTKICKNCAMNVNDSGEILCKLCALAAMNADGGLAFDSSEEEECKGFDGGSVRQSGKVTFEKESGQVVGWDSIWAIIEGEENEKKALEEKLGAGVQSYVARMSRPINHGVAGGPGSLPTPSS